MCLYIVYVFFNLNFEMHVYFNLNFIFKKIPNRVAHFYCLLVVKQGYVPQSGLMFLCQLKCSKFYETKHF